jgi:hypothetical protein
VAEKMGDQPDTGNQHEAESKKTFEALQGFSLVIGLGRA